MSDHCGYSKCRAELPAPGPQGGRRRAFCRDTRWEAGRTCAQMARAERDALDALGLDSSRAAFGIDADRLREHVEAVRGPVEALVVALAAVTTRIDEVEAHAVAAVEEANRRAAAAEQSRVTAEEARDDAVRRARRSAEAADRAVAERAEAVDRATVAARRELEATEALGAARQQADEATAARQVAGERLAAAERETRDAQLAAGRAAVERDADRDRAEVLAQEKEQARRAATAADAARAREADRATAAVAELETERAARAAVLTELAATRTAAAADRDWHRSELAAMREELRAATERAGRADEEIGRLRADREASRPGEAELRALLTAVAAGPTVAAAATDRSEIDGIAPGGAETSIST